ncbi:MAG: putative esterase YcpF (UPF0227 family) [Kiritimatiellia bacterium]|jgi:predicted esterase YcpF (UPF0227 family)
MPQLLYIHGFLSSPQSYKAQQMQCWLQQHHPEIIYHCPLLTPHPDDCVNTLINIVETARATKDPLYLMGSSMGGFWASYLAERYDLPAILINPAVDVIELMPRYLEQPLQNYHTDDVYCLKADDLVQLSRYDTPIIKRHNNYWLLVQEGDETLDYRLAVTKYRQCQQTIEQGGDHSFQGFERFHEQAITFYNTYSLR